MLGHWRRQRSSVSRELPPHHRYLDSRDPLIELRSVDKTYTTVAGPSAALRGVSLRVGAGEFVAVIGKSGSGKSTLINVVAGIDRPTSGAVLVDGTPIHLLDENALAVWRGRKLGLIFQFFQLLPTLTLLENVMLPMEPSRDSDVVVMSLDREAFDQMMSGSSPTQESIMHAMRERLLNLQRSTVR